MSEFEDSPDAEPTQDPEQPGEEPEVYAVKRAGSRWQMDRRSALRSLGAASAALGSAGCASNKMDPSRPADDEDDEGGGGAGGNDEAPEGEDPAGAWHGPIPYDPVVEFDAKGVTYLLADLRAYDGCMPVSGKNLTVVGFIDGDAENRAESATLVDLYFRRFDATGRPNANFHESKLADGISGLMTFKSLVKGLATRRSITPDEQLRFANFVSGLLDRARSGALTPSPDSETSRRSPEARQRDEQKARIEAAHEQYRRLREAGLDVETALKRMSASPPPEADPEPRAQPPPSPPDPQRTYDAVTINGKKHYDVQVQAAYTDGTTKLRHRHGIGLYPTEWLPELVRMQLPAEIPNPKPASGLTVMDATRPAPGIPRNIGTFRNRPRVAGVGPQPDSEDLNDMLEEMRRNRSQEKAGGSGSSFPGTSGFGGGFGGGRGTRTYSYHYWRPN